MIVFSMMVFCIAITLQEVLELVLAYLNHGYRKDKSRLQKVQEQLKITSEELQAAQAYSKDRYRFGMIKSVTSLVGFLAFILFGGWVFFEKFAVNIVSAIGITDPYHIIEGCVFFISLSLVYQIAGLGFSIYNSFVLEEKHGFNRMTAKLFVLDCIKGLVLGVVLASLMLSGGIYLVSVLDHWWLWLWGFLSVVSLFLMWIAPVVIEPLFHKFTPLNKDSELYQKICNIAEKSQFRLNGIFTKNASIRSSHGNAYFSGIFNKKKIVLFDTLIEKLTTNQVVAVMAHELGHFKLHHVRLALIMNFVIDGLLFWLLFSVVESTSIYENFGFSGYKPYLAIFFLFLWKGVIDFFITPVHSFVSRSNEFAADRYAVELLSQGEDLSEALVALHNNSRALPIYHPVFSQFYLSHPPLTERIEAMKQIRAAVSD